MVQENDVEVLEIKLDDEKIDELIQKLNDLKENKEHIHLDDKNKNHIIFVHEESEIL
ncbi:MAG: hypothetical protein KKA65_01290 [Nanoarchaeota archaeon]|nr:hypothetical protein [Nanoarchaeota archaeon]MBU4352710.1 hypothetical protein [Nanoarchaeota archaeon]MBU4456114.1 hypothetical protein [Nanoarchaeota archaeon]